MRLTDSLAEFTIDNTDLLDPKVTVNGEPVHGLRALTLHAGPQVIPPVLHLEVAAAGTVTGHGVVKVYEAEDGEQVPEGEAVARFLASVDPGQLEDAVLARATGQSGSIFAAVLAVLVEQARGIG